MILIKSFIYKNKIKEDKKPTLEFYEWKRIYFKMIVLHEIKEIYKKQIHHHHHPNKLKWRNSIINRSAYF